MLRLNAYSLYLTIALSVIWVALYSLNHWLFQFTEITPWVSLVFIPSGFKVACAAIYRWRSILGLFLGSFVTGFLFLKNFSLVDVAMFSLFSATLPYTALRLSEKILFFENDLSNLSIRRISLLALIYALLNGFFHVAYCYHVLFLRDVHAVKALLSMMLGDVLGVFLFMWMVARTFKYLASIRFNA